MPSTSPKDGLLKTEGRGWIGEAALNAGILNEREVIAGNLLRFNQGIIFNGFVKDRVSNGSAYTKMVKISLAEPGKRIKR